MGRTFFERRKIFAADFHATRRVKFQNFSGETNLILPDSANFFNKSYAVYFVQGRRTIEKFFNG
jgi:hypothetical protein